MSGDYTYYSDGFFGFGSPGAFIAYSLMHFIPVLLCAAALVFIWRKREDLRAWKREETLRRWLSFSMFLMEFSFFVWLLYVGDTSGNYLMMSKLPLHLCDIGLISCMYMVISKNRTLFGFNFFVLPRACPHYHDFCIGIDTLNAERKSIYPAIDFGIGHCRAATALRH